MTADPSNPDKNSSTARICAHCNWFLRLEVARCCCASSPLAGNVDPRQSCDKWVKRRPPSNPYAMPFGPNSSANAK